LSYSKANDLTFSPSDKLPASFTLRAGPGARALIARHGLSPEIVGCIGAAAGGPKWLILGRLDQAIFAEWLAAPAKPIPAIGSSIGAFRLACAAQADAGAAYARFEEAYFGQQYSARPGPSEITREGRKLIAAIFANGPEAALESRRLQLHFVVAKLRGLTTAQNASAQKLGYGLAYLAHAARPRGLARHVERYVFFAGRTHAAPIGDDGFRTSWIALSRENLAEAILASGTLPLIMDRIEEIAGAPAGHYVDGGLIDYQMDLALADPEKLLFLPHYEQRIVPRWFDKTLPWRRARNTDRMLILSPSAETLARLDRGRIPSRKDFKTFRGDDTARLATWRRAVDASQRMADEFRELLATGKLEAAVEPL
jgi:hypothetical protein